MDFKDLTEQEASTETVDLTITLYKQMVETLGSNVGNDPALTALVNLLAHNVIVRFGERAYPQGFAAVCEGLAECIKANLELQAQRKTH